MFVLKESDWNRCFERYNKIKNNWHKERGHAISHLKAGVLIWRFSICYSHSSVSLTVNRKLCRIHMLKGLQCHGCLFHFVTCTIALCAMKLEVNKEVTCKRRNHSLLYKEYTSQALPSNVANNNNALWKTVGLSSQKPTLISTRFNLLQVCPSLPTFVFALLLILYSNVLRDNFSFTQFGGSFTVRNLWHRSFNMCY